MKKLLSTLIAGVCAIACAFSFVACGGGNSNGNTHTKHNWSSTYTDDVSTVDGITVVNSDRHYQTCDGCDEKQYSNHDYGTSGVCVCGKTKPSTEHTDHKWSKTYTPDDARNQHYQTCDGCDDKQYSDHNYGTSGVCVCGKTTPETDIPAESVSLDKTNIELEVGGEGTKLTATVLPENATDKKVTYSVEPAGVVSVDNDGNVTALDEGSAVITATTTNGKKATCNVTVTKPLTNAEVLEFLNENVTNEVAKQFADAYFVEFNSNNVSNVEWFITKADNNVTEANIIFNYLRTAHSSYINLYKIAFAAPLTPQNIKNGEIGDYTCTQLYTSDSINPAIQDEHTDLTNAICDKLFGTNANSTRYIIDQGWNDLDPNFPNGNASYFVVFEITNTEIKEKTIAITFDNQGADDELINKLTSESNYFTSHDNSYAITGTKLVNNNEKF